MVALAVVFFGVDIGVGVSVCVLYHDEPAYERIRDMFFDLQYKREISFCSRVVQLFAL